MRKNVPIGKLRNVEQKFSFTERDATSQINRLLPVHRTQMLVMLRMHLLKCISGIAIQIWTGSAASDASQDGWSL